MKDAERIKNMVEKDSMGAALKVAEIIKSDVAALLGEFMNVTDIDVFVEKSEKGYSLNITASSDGLFEIGNLTSDLA